MGNTLIFKKNMVLSALCLLACLSLGCFDDFYGKLLDEGAGKSLYISYDANEATGGTVPVDAAAYYTGENVTVLGNTGNLTRTGYSFAGWNTRSDGNGDTYSQGQLFTMGASDTVLYARWTLLPTYTVTYNGNTSTGGTPPVDSTNYIQGQTVTALGNTGSLVKTGYAFTGWNTAANGSGTAYTPGQTFAMGTANVTLYAQWALTYTVTYNGNGNTSGTPPVDSGSYIQGQTVTVLGNTGKLLRINVSGVSYKFNGWNTQANGSGTSYSAGATFQISSNTTLYAMWTPYVLRDIGPAGGYIFYDKGSYSDGWRYLEACSLQWETTGPYGWGADGTLIGTTNTGIGTGLANTTDIVAWMDANGGSGVAKSCSNLTNGGYSDWFLPSFDELNLMYTNLHLQGVGNFYSRRYWSSSEDSSVSARCIYFVDGTTANYSKSWQYNSGRPVRAF